MSPELFISVVSVAIAFSALVLNFVLTRRAAVRARKPVLVFVYEAEHPETTGWVLRNVGNGPALNVLVATREEGQWFNPVRVPPLAREASFALTWLGQTNTAGLGASYGDFEGRRYTSTLGGEVSRAYEGNRLPEWDDEEIVRYWELPTALARALSWGARTSAFRA